MSTFEAPNDYRNYLMHYGVKGMKWRNHRRSQMSKFGRLDESSERDRALTEREEDTANRRTRRQRDQSHSQYYAEQFERERARREAEKSREEEIRAEERRREAEERANIKNVRRPNTLSGLTSYKAPHSRTNPGDLTHLINKKKQEARSRRRIH